MSWRGGAPRFDVQRHHLVCESWRGLPELEHCLRSKENLNEYGCCQILALSAAQGTIDATQVPALVSVYLLYGYHPSLRSVHASQQDTSSLLERNTSIYTVPSS